MRTLGLPDSRIVLMLADDHACSAANPLTGELFNVDGEREAGRSLYPPDVEVDYGGAAVTEDALLRLLTGRVLPGTPRNQRWDGGPGGRLLLYLTGEGGGNYGRASRVRRWWRAAPHREGGAACGRYCDST